MVIVQNYRNVSDQFCLLLIGLYVQVEKKKGKEDEDLLSEGEEQGGIWDSISK